MLRHRLIPTLLLEDGGLVKTRRFKEPRYVGDPVNGIRIFNDKEVDEIIVLDIGVSRAGSEPDYALIETFAGECFMPLAYGGGVRNVDQAARLFAGGVEKVCLQSAALEDLSTVSRVAERFGEQSVVVSVDIKRDMFGRSRLYDAARRKVLPRPWVEFAQAAVSAGAGEILLTAVDRDGTLGGPDLDLVAQANAALAVPLIASGGVAGLDDVRAAIAAGANAVAAGAWFVFSGPHRAVLITYPSAEELRPVLEAAR